MCYFLYSMRLYGAVIYFKNVSHLFYCHYTTTNASVTGDGMLVLLLFSFPFTCRVIFRLEFGWFVGFLFGVDSFPRSKHTEHRTNVKWEITHRSYSSERVCIRDAIFSIKCTHTIRMRCSRMRLKHLLWRAKRSDRGKCEHKLRKTMCSYFHFDQVKIFIEEYT